MSEERSAEGEFRHRARALLATLPPFGALAAQLALWPYIESSVWFLFYPAVFLSFWIGGLRSGILATIVSTASVLWFFVPPQHSLIKAPALYLPACVFSATGLLFGLFHERLRRANRESARALAASERANQDLQGAIRQRQIFAAFLENSPDFIGIADASGKPVYLNPAGHRMVGLASDYPIENTQIPEYYPAEQRAFAADVIVKAMIEKGRWQGETYFRHWQTGDAIPVSDTHFMIRDPASGQILGMGTITRDISDIRRARDQLQKASDEVTRLYEKTKELDELKTQFFASVSHELRTPLALILLPTERLLQAPDTPEAVRNDLSVVVRNARTLLAHVNNLLDITKLDAGRMKAEYAQQDLAHLARFVAGHFEILSQETNTELDVEVPDKLPAQVDPEKVQRILLNLLSNAFKVTPTGGHVRLTLREAAERVSFEVADTGPGIPTDKREVVFDRFHQLEGGTTRHFGGTGLGLSIAREFAVLHGGSISISQAPEGGALFVVDLPRTAPPGVAVRPMAEAAAEVSAEAQRAVAELRRRPAAVVAPTPGHDALVLVVEDNPEMSRFITENLAAEYRVVTAFDGKQGFEQARSLKPDLILSDIMMPEMTGEELVLALRRCPELDSTPILLLTAKADDELRVRLLREGAQDYLTKPFSMEELRARVGAHIARRRAEERSHTLRQQVEAVAQASLSVSQAVASLPETSVRTVLKTIALNAQSLTSADFVAVGIGSDPSRPFDTWVFVGMSEEQAKLIGQHPRPTGLLGLVVREDGPVRLRDLRRHPAHRGFPPNHPLMTSFLGVPIRYRGHVVGNLYLANKQGAAEFTDQDQRLVEMLAARAGVAIETARLYSAEGMERAWLQAVVEQMPEGIILMDAQGRLTVQNRTVLALAGPEPHARDPFGNSFPLELRRPSGERLPLDDLPIVKAITHQEMTQSCELIARRADGRLVPLLVSAAPVRAASGDLAGATMILQDVSTLKELEHLREEWASIVAHDLQQPIYAIMLWADLLLRAGLAEDRNADVRQIRTAAKQLSRMVSDLMDASQLETHRLPVTLERLDLGELVREIVGRMPDASARTKIRTPADRRLLVRGDAQRLEQILANLLSNALKYGASGAAIMVEAEEEDGNAKISVSNRGPGIPADELPILFERYVRSRAARTSATMGSGLGLYIAKGLVEAHGGRIWAESIPGGTTAFRFTIPLDGQPSPNATALPQPAEHDAASPTERNQDQA